MGFRPWSGQGIRQILTPSRTCGTLWELKSIKKLPTSKASLIKIIEKVWFEEISIVYLQNLVDSMPQRIRDVIEAKGGSTKY